MSKNIVIIPTYNEKENIVNIIDAVLALRTRFHILIIDDGSPDGTANLIKAKMKHHQESIFLIEREGKLGLGTAYIKGFQWAVERNYDYICEMDADFSHNPRDLVNLQKACEKGADVAIGSRYVSGVNVINWPIGRVLMSYFASYYVRLITGMPFMDTTAGFKCYKKRVLEIIDPNKIKFIGYAFQIEMKFNAWKHGFHMLEVPIIFTDRTKGTSKMSKGIFREAVIGVLEMKIRSLFHKYIPAPSQIEWLSQAQPSKLSSQE